MDWVVQWRRLAAVFMASLVLLAGVMTTVVSSAVAQDATPGSEGESALGVVPGPGEDEVTVTHAQGETVVKLNPEVVFSYDIASVDTLGALGIHVDGMPTLTTGADRYETERDLEIGTLFEPDYEVVNAEQPDLIIIAGRSAEAYPELSKLAPTIDLSFSSGNMIEDLTANTIILATIFGKQDEAQAILDSINERVEALRAQVGDLGTGLIVMTSGGSVTALAPDTARAGRGAMIYHVLGVQPPVEDVAAATHGEPISFEFLLEHNPDWLFVIDRDQATGTEDSQPAEQVLDNELVHQTTAWQEGQIIYLDSFNWYIITGAGLNSMQSMLDELEVAFGA